MSKRASELFAFFSVVIVGMTVAALNIDRIPHASAFSNFFWAVGGVLMGFGMFFLWGGMWRYWIERDPSRRTVRRIWFVILLVGIWYGAILYYACVYVPTTRRRGRTPTEDLAE